MSAYAADEIRRLLANGTQPDEDFYRLKVTGYGATNWVNVTPAQLASIATLLSLDLPSVYDVPRSDFLSLDSAAHQIAAAMVRFDAGVANVQGACDTDTMNTMLAVARELYEETLT